MSEVKLVMAIIEFLKDEAEREDVSEGSAESLEVAIECLKTAYDLDFSNPMLSRLKVNVPLVEIFNSKVVQLELNETLDPADVKQRAESLKNLGNTFMKAEQHSAAIKSYTDAISYDSSNAVYYCNRAAAFAKLEDYRRALADCERAIALNPNYAKAYGRMGLAYSSLHKPDRAVDCFKKAVELEPINESYKSYLKMEEVKMKGPPSSSNSTGTPLMPNFDWQSVFNNPAFRNMATSLLQDPNIMNAFSGAAAAPAPAPATGDQGTSSAFNVDRNSLFEAGQYIATQMQAVNPDLVEQLRNIATGSSPNPRNEENRDTTPE